MISTLVASAFLAGPMDVPPGAPEHPHFTIAQFVAASGSGFDEWPFDYDILLKAVQTANLVDPLNNPAADLTLFAPNDLGFIRLARDLGYTGTSEAEAWDFLVQALTQLGNGNPIPVLTNVLLYHVAPESLNAFQVLILGFLQEPVVTLLPGATFQPRWFRLIDNEPDLRDPYLFIPLNVRASNGIVHTIERVLIPVDLP